MKETVSELNRCILNTIFLLSLNTVKTTNNHHGFFKQNMCRSILVEVCAQLFTLYLFYTIGRKNVPLYFCPYLRQLLTDF